MHGSSWRLRLRHHGFGGEVEGDAEHVGVFHVEEALFVQVVGLAAQRAAHHLFAQQLGAEGAHAQNVGDGVGVPAFGEHGNGNHAADGLAEALRLADGVHHFAQQVLVGEGFGLAAIAGAFHDLAAEAFDFVGGHGAEVVVQRFAGFQAFAVDQQRVRAGEGLALLVEVAEQGEVAVAHGGFAGFVFDLGAGDVVVEQLRGGLVVAHDDEAGRRFDVRLAPFVERLFVVAVERVEGGSQFVRQGERIAGAGHALADVFPQVAEHQRIGGWQVVRHRHPWQLDDAAFDGVHQREVAHRPREQRAFRVAGTAQEERRGGKVDHAADAEFRLHRLQAAQPHSRRLLVLLRLLAFVALERGLPRFCPACRRSSGGLRR